MKSLRILVFSALALMVITRAGAISVPEPTPPRKQIQESQPGAILDLDWEDLVPDKERERYTLELPPIPTDHYLDESGPPAAQLGSAAVNEDLNDVMVKLPGFIVPLEMSAKGVVSEFLLVPFFGACIHVPPPPPNQIVFVRMKKGVSLQSIYDAYSITGRLKTTRVASRLASAAYSLEGDKAEIYE